MSKEETTNNRKRLQVGMLLAGLVLPGLEAGAAPDNQCPCDISVGVLARHGITPSEIQTIRCTRGLFEAGTLNLTIFTQDLRGDIGVSHASRPPGCVVQISELQSDGNVVYRDAKQPITSQQATACDDDTVRTARALHEECPE